MLNGKNVILDATNLKRKNRRHLIDNILKDVPCEKVCVLFATPYECCLKNNASRDRKVPEHVLERMYKNFEVPCYAEKWDDIQIVYWDYEKDGLEFDFEKDLEVWKSISHDNPHHHLSIGNHMQKAYEYMSEKTDNALLLLATYLHDCGKIVTKDYHDSKGNPTGNVAHYYQHHCCGSYDSLFYLKGLPNDDVLYVSLLIGLHMNPFLKWSNSERAKEKDRRLFGEKVYSDIIKLHEADLAAK